MPLGRKGMFKRKSGILLHISSLPSKFGIGDLGPGAYHFADFLHKTKQSFWQILPVNPTDPISGHSPYSSLSAFAANILFISPELLVDEGILCKNDVKDKPKFSSTTVQYKTVRSFKETILDHAYGHFVSDASIRQTAEAEFNDFISENKLSRSIWNQLYIGNNK